MANLGRINRPEVSSFKAGRRLLVVNIIGNLSVTDKEKKTKFEGKLAQYWNQIKSQISGLSKKLGKVGKIFHEYVSKDKQEGLNQLEKLDKNTHNIVKELVDEGAAFYGIEDENLLNELRDWQRCMMSGLSSFSVQEKVLSELRDVAQKRDEFMKKRLGELIEEDGTSLIFVTNSKQFKFPETVETFFIEPPALDDISVMIKEFYADYDKKE